MKVSGKKKIKPLIIGVSGGTGSGKTTVVEAILRDLKYQDVITLEHDSYYKDRSDLPITEREKINFDHPDALQTELLITHLKELIKGKSVNVPLYDFATHTRKKEGKRIESARVIFVEGILIFTERELRELMDIRIFVDTDDDIRFIRRLTRDIKERKRTVRSVIRQYLATVRPMHLEFVEPSKKYAHIIVPEGHNPVAIDLVASMINNKFENGT